MTTIKRINLIKTGMNSVIHQLLQTTFLTLAFTLSAQAQSGHEITNAAEAGISHAVEKDARVQANGKTWRLEKAVVTDATLPRVLLVGDSILNGYLYFAVKSLNGKANVDAWVNPYYQSEKFNALLAEVLTHGQYAVVHINVGLHGWQKDRVDSGKAEKQSRIPEGQFEPLTKAFVKVIRQKCPKAKIIWASTTPIMTQGKVELDAELNSIIIEHNRMAAKVMAEEKIPVDDLYTLMAGNLALARGDQFHWSVNGSKLLADTVSKSVIAALNEKP